jgi:CheY-like chemotaxis protein
VAQKILCVDDEANILEGIARHFRKQFEIDTAVGGEQGLLALVERGPYAVVVSDMRMPIMDGAEFLARVRNLSPSTVRMILTGQADLHDAIAAVNEGNIFRFLTKPCPPEMLSRALTAALEQHRLVNAERELLEKTLSGSIKTLVEVLGIVNPDAVSRTSRIQRYVRHIAEQLQCPNLWELDLAALLSQIGCITLPTALLVKVYAGAQLNSKETETFSSHARLAQSLLAQIPRLEGVAQMVGSQNKSIREMIAANMSEAAVQGAQILHVAIDFDRWTLRGEPPAAAIMQMSGERRFYDPAIVHALEGVIVDEPALAVRTVELDEIIIGMVTNEDVRTKDGLLLLAKGQEISSSALAYLRSFKKTVGLVEPLLVLVPAASVPVLSRILQPVVR